jgi:hypothetical protein
MQVTTGRTVLYTLSERDAEQVNRRRTNSGFIGERIRDEKWPLGAQAHIGNSAQAGDTVPLVVVRVWPNEFGEGKHGVNGQAILDGNDVLWVTSAKENDQSNPPGEFGTWRWPERN